MHGTSAYKHHLKRQRAKEGVPLKSTFWAGVIDTLIYPIGFLGVLMALPQAYSVWILGQTEGVSLITWASWSLFSIVWILYGVIHKANAIIFIQSSWLVMHLAVALGILVNS
jgi:uncharacterized protein with PQ loop repeat